jgi:hypothetical protein
MVTSDKRAARTAAFGVLLVAITAAVISFSHVRTVAIRAGETELTSWLLPISIDGAVVAAVAVLLADSRAGRPPGVLTWLLLALGLSASLVANIASAEPTPTARAVAAWPPLALALGIEVLAGLARQQEPEQLLESAADHRWPSGSVPGLKIGTTKTPRRHRRPAGGAPGTMPAAAVAANGTGWPAHRRPTLDDTTAVEMIRELDAAAPAGRASRLEIQRKLGCGGSRAARLAELARRPALDAAS